jgi:hypothetical protein
VTRSTYHPSVQILHNIIPVQIEGLGMPPAASADQQMEFGMSRDDESRMVPSVHDGRCVAFSLS